MKWIIMNRIAIIGNGGINSISDDFFRDVIKRKVNNAKYYYAYGKHNSLLDVLFRVNRLPLPVEVIIATSLSLF